MPRNGSGVYTPPANSFNPAVPDTEINATDWNSTLDDLAEAMTDSIAADGQTTITANIPMAGYKLTGVGAATTLGDALSYGRAANVTTLTATGALTYGGVTFSNAVTGTGSLVGNINPTLTNPVFTTPSLGVASATSLAIGGATIGSNSLAVTGTAAISGTLSSAAITMNAGSAITGSTFTAARNGNVNYLFQNTSTAASPETNVWLYADTVNGYLSVRKSGSSVNLVAADGAALNLTASGGGTATLSSPAGATVISGNSGITLSSATTMSAALTYGGVTLNNSVTGTGSMVLATSPTLATPTLGAASATSVVITGGSFAAGKLYADAASGLVIAAKTGSGNDLLIATPGGADILSVPTGTSGVKLAGGLQMGSPTGGNKGVGTINVAADIYKNNTAYTNPDYVLEHWATGEIVKFADKEGAATYTGLKPLSYVEGFVRENLHLPRFGQTAGHGVFSGSDALLASLEEAYLYIFDLEKRLSALENK